MSADYYAILGVEKGAAADEIKRAYKKLAVKWHPDRNREDPDAEKKFKEINEAYQVLSDPEQRVRYDSMGSGPAPGGFGFTADGFPDIGFPGGFGRASEIFEEMFARDMNRRPKQRGPVRGTDIEIPLRITMLESIEGVTKDITYDIREVCDSCDGKGHEESDGPHKCHACNGQGARRQVKGPVMFTMTCNACMGTGEVPGDACAVCRGSGRRNVTKTAKVKIPPGIDRGNVLRHSGHGEPGARGGPPGDLFVVIGIEPHPTYDREGTDLFTSAHATYATCVLGGMMDVELLDGKRKSVRIPPGTKPGSTVVLAGEGAPDVNGAGKGKLHIEVKLAMPEIITDRAKDLLRELESELSHS